MKQFRDWTPGPYAEPSPPGAPPSWRWFQKQFRLGRGLERLVAGIMRVENPGATVRSNESIGGRQFDVVVRRLKDGASEMAVVECRDRRAKVPVGAIDELITKAGDVQATRVVFVSQRWFSREAIRVARRHQVELYLLTEIIEPLKPRIVEEPGEAVNVRHIRFVAPNAVPLPGSPQSERELLTATMMSFPDGTRLPFHEWVRRYHDQVVPALRAKAAPEEFEVVLLPGVTVAFADGEDRPVKTIQFEAEIVSMAMKKLVDRPVNVAEIRSFEWQRIDAPGTKTFHAGDLPIGDEVFQAGSFYRNSMGLRYKCLTVGETDALVRLLEPSHALSADIKVPLEFAPYYVPIEDCDEISELEAFSARQGDGD